MSIIGKLAVDGIKFILNKIQKDTKLQGFIGSYLENNYEKYTQVKTFLHGGKNLNFDEFYFPLSIKPRYSSKAKLRNATDLLAQKTPNYITIIGNAGSGKSTFVKNMFMDVIKQQKGIPFLIELRHLKNNTSIDDYISNEIVKDKELYRPLTQLFKDEQMVFFLDGFDELPKDTKSKILSNFIDSYPNNKFVLTSRPSSNAEKLERFENYQLNLLNDEEVINFTKKQLEFINDSAEIESGLIESLTVGLENEAIKTFLSNPLLLSIYILTFQKSPDIPKSKNLFYRRVLDALVYQHDAETKPGFSRSKACDFGQDVLEKILKKFSFQTYVEDIYTWNKEELEKTLTTVGDYLNIKFNNPDLISDMTRAFSLWTEDEGEYTFSHRSFQEFFACHYIKESEKKKTIYEMLLKQFMSGENRREINNLLSLLEETDEEPFIENFKLPLFRSIDYILNKNSKQFLRENIQYLYSFGTPKLIMEEYKACHEVIDSYDDLQERSTRELKGLIMGMGMRMRMERGVRMEKGVRMVMEIEMGMEKGIRIGMGVRVGMEIEMGMEKGMRMGMDMVMAMVREIKKGGRVVKREIFSQKLIQCFKETVLKKERKDTNLINDLSEGGILYAGYLSVLTKENIAHLQDYPFVRAKNLTNLFSKIVRFSDSSKTIISFIENNKNQYIPVDNLEEDVLLDCEKKIESDYQKYRSFIDQEIAELESKLEKYSTNNNNDLALF